MCMCMCMLHMYCATAITKLKLDRNFPGNGGRLTSYKYSPIQFLSHSEKFSTFPSFGYLNKNEVVCLESMLVRDNLFYCNIAQETLSTNKAETNLLLGRASHSRDGVELIAEVRAKAVPKWKNK